MPRLSRRFNLAPYRRRTQRRRRFQARNRIIGSANSVFPDYRSQFVVPMCLRYKFLNTGSAISADICNYSLLASLAVRDADGVHALNGLFQAVRLKKVLFTGYSLADADVTTVSILDYSTTREIAANGNAVTPFSITWVPTRDSFCNQWQFASASRVPLLNLKNDALMGNAIVDLHFDAILNDNLANSYYVAGTIALAASGYIYTMALDLLTGGGAYNSSPSYVPVGRLTIV